MADIARHDFLAEYGCDLGAPVAVVIAALDEAGTIADVISGVPAVVAGLETRCVVVDDGSSDGTAEAARRAGARVCRLDVNLGQGAALQVGYSLARDCGAEVIATLDADGQFDPGEMERLVGPIVAGRADFVNGSRRLGTSHTSDPLRGAGVVVFGWLVSRLTGTRITDPANGFRAFRSSVTATVQLRQVQYQTAELLISAAAAGFRVLEAPVTVRRRATGESRKGGNLRYGYRFGRVIVSSWWWSLRNGYPAAADGRER